MLAIDQSITICNVYVCMYSGTSLKIKSTSLYKIISVVHGNILLPLKEDNLSITVKLAGPKESII